AGSAESLPALIQWIIACDVADDLVGSPDDAALATREELPPSVRAVFADESIGIFRPYRLRVDDVDRRAGAFASRVLNSARCRCTAGLVAVEAEHHALHTEPTQPVEEARAGRRAA